MSTLDLFGWTPEPEKPDKPRAKPATIEERFELFDKINPQVFDEMKRLARARIAAGQTFISIKALWEELRVSLDLAAQACAMDKGESFKLNNSYTALYARKLIASDQMFAAVIETRRRKGER